MDTVETLSAERLVLVAAILTEALPRLLQLTQGLPLRHPAAAVRSEADGPGSVEDLAEVRGLAVWGVGRWCEAGDHPDPDAESLTAASALWIDADHGTWVLLQGSGVRVAENGREHWSIRSRAVDDIARLLPVDVDLPQTVHQAWEQLVEAHVAQRRQAAEVVREAAAPEMALREQCHRLRQALAGWRSAQ